MFALVAVPVPLGQAFSYSVPPELQEQLEGGAGVRVLCSFGRRKVMGVVLELQSEAPPGIAPEKLKPLLAVVDTEPALPADLLRFLRELGSYYLAPIGEVMRLALPAVERSQSNPNQALFEEAGVKAVGKVVQIASAVAEPPEVDPPKGQAAAVLELLRQEGPTAVSELAKQFGNARAATKRLVELGLVSIEQQSVHRDRFLDSPVQRDEPKPLNAAQSAALSAITASLQASTAPLKAVVATQRPATERSGSAQPISAAQQPSAFLLHGVTGSGKTEVYLQAVSECLETGGGAIILVPEIALTPQLVSRFRARFGDQIAVLHSGLSDSERYQMWRRLREGERRVAVGARSALFAPVHQLRLICVDEEHDTSFKQEEGVRYQARDMALLRAHRAGAVCVLGSATPSLSTVALVEQGKVERLVLPDRAVAQSALPRIEVINLRQHGPGPTGHRLISLPLFRALSETLERQQQAILFLNRRGFAPSLICDDCGNVVHCPNCSVSLTFHRERGGRLKCHYCEFETSSELECSNCQSRSLVQEGVGTEGIEAALSEAFPKARVGRLDRDVAGGLKSERILDKMRDRQLDILVGTQMVTKGHDLPGVALVGVLNADAALSLPDFQAAERTFQLLVQVAGRAGRGSQAGRVLVQTRQPDHPAIRFATQHDVASFSQRELRERKEANYPPYCRMIMVRVDSLNERVAAATADSLSDLARRECGTEAEVLGPSPAPIERLRNRYRFRFILRATKRAPLFKAARAIRACQLDRRVRVQVDIDPVTML